MRGISYEIQEEDYNTGVESLGIFAVVVEWHACHRKAFPGMLVGKIVSRI